MNKMILSTLYCMSVSLTKSKDLIANSISVIDKNEIIDLQKLFLSKLDAITNIVGLPVATLDSLQKLAEAINSDAKFLILLWLLLI